MTQKIYLITDLGPGDGGKGGVVHKIATNRNADYVLKFGGGQGSHGVVTASGEKFNFSHWGCGTLDGIPTLITPDFVTIPHAILNEGAALERLGLHDPYALLTIDPHALVATPFHGIASRLDELIRRDHPRGTIGTGAGHAYRLTKDYAGLTLRITDLKDPAKTRATLQEIVNFYQSQFAPFRSFEFLPDDRSQAEQLFAELWDPDYIDWTLEQYDRLIHTSIRILPQSDLLKSLHLAVAECSHGVLTDSELGFLPHTSALRTIPDIHLRSLRSSGYSGQVIQLGVTRAYAIRHGAGPLPTADQTMRESLLPDSHKSANRWQGDVRVGPIDFNLLRYAVSCCANRFDGICVTWMDQILKNGLWKICDHYQPPLTHYDVASLSEAHPHYSLIDLSDLTTNAVARICNKVFTHHLGIPVRMVSFGPDDHNKILL